MEQIDKALALPRSPPCLALRQPETTWYHSRLRTASGDGGRLTRIHRTASVAGGNLNKAALGKNERTGNPKVESAANGYTFNVYFYGCKEARDCSSLSFVTIFEKDFDQHARRSPTSGTATTASARWRCRKTARWRSAYDVTTVGGLNQTNFRRRGRLVADDARPGEQVLQGTPGEVELRLLAQTSRSRGISSTKLQGRFRLSSCSARIRSQPSFTAPFEPGSAKM